MSSERVRDEIAGLLGWTKKPASAGRGYRFGKGPAPLPDLVWHDSKGVEFPNSFRHPVELSLDWLSANWPEGWEWEKRVFCDRMWRAAPKDREKTPTNLLPWQCIVICDTGDEIHDRLALMLAVLKAEKGTQ